MFAPFSCDVDGINNERQIVLRKRNYVVALKGLIIFVTIIIVQHYFSLCNLCIDGSVIFHDSFSLNSFSGCLAP